MGIALHCARQPARHPPPARDGLVVRPGGRWSTWWRSHALEAAAFLPDPERARQVFGILKYADGLARVPLRDLDVRRLRLAPSRLREPRALELLRESPQERIDLGYVV